MKENILILICDQLSALALSVYGNDYSNTPNIDELSKNGVVFENVYSTCPLCQPSRASFYTSLYPNQTNVISNLPNQVISKVDEEIPTLASSLKDYYNCLHFGKDHAYGALRGFNIASEVKVDVEIDKKLKEFSVAYETFFDEDTVNKVESFFAAIENKEKIDKKNVDIYGEKPNSKIEEYDYEKPFLLAVDLQNPHNICSYIGEHEFETPNIIDENLLPHLPENFDTKDLFFRPPLVQYLCCAHRRLSQTISWKEKDFRYYLYAYYYYLNIVDKQIGRIISSLKASGKYENTLIMLFADHGEGMAAHKMVTKYGTFYEETNRVPFIIKADQDTNKSLEAVSSNTYSLIDVFPTILGYANMLKSIKSYEKIANKLEGQNIFDVAKGEKARDYAVAQWHDEFEGYFVPGRMYADKDYKYIMYIDKPSSTIYKELYDMKNDRLEKRNLSLDDKYKNVLSEYKNKLDKHIKKTNDNFYLLKPNYSDEFRNHKPCYSEHKGDNAVLLYQKKIDLQKN